MCRVALRIGNFAAEQNHLQRRRGARRQIGKHRAEVEQQIDIDPEPWPGERAELATENGLAGVQRVAADLDVVKRLEHDAERRQPEHCSAVARGDRRPQQPLAAADRRGAHHQPRADERPQVAKAHLRHIDQLARVPARHFLGARMRRGQFDFWCKRGRHRTDSGFGVQGSERQADRRLPFASAADKHFPAHIGLRPISIALSRLESGVRGHSLATSTSH
jgi:hypothetical protein